MIIAHKNIIQKHKGSPRPCQLGLNQRNLPIVSVPPSEEFYLIPLGFGKKFEIKQSVARAGGDSSHHVQDYSVGISSHCCRLNV